MKQPLQSEEEKKLLLSWRAGNSESFGILLNHYLDAIYALAFRLTGGNDDAQDLVHNAVVRAIQARSKCRDGVTFHAWMRRVVTNLFLDGLRKNKRGPQEEAWDDEQTALDNSTVEHPRQHMANKEREQFVLDCLASLSPVYRSVLVLREFEDLSYQEIADLHGVSVETIRTQLRRAREQMRKLLSPLAGE